MPRYNVHYWQQVVRHFEVEVEADCKEDAKEAAHDLIWAGKVKSRDKTQDSNTSVYENVAS